MKGQRLAPVQERKEERFKVNFKLFNFEFYINTSLSLLYIMSLFYYTIMFFCCSISIHCSSGYRELFGGSVAVCFTFIFFCYVCVNLIVYLGQ